MNSFISSLVLVAVAASSNGAAATDSSHPDRSSVREIFSFISTVLGHERLGAGDWRSALACTADLDGDAPGLVDETACPTTKTGGGGDCVWCDSSEMIGTGVCVGPDLKDEAGAIWDAVCGAPANDDAPDDADPRRGPRRQQPVRNDQVFPGRVDVRRRRRDGLPYYYPDFPVHSCSFGQDFPAWMGSKSYEKSFLFTRAETCCTKYFPMSNNCPYEDESHTKEGSYLRGVHDEIVLGDHL